MYQTGAEFLQLFAEGGGEGTGESGNEAVAQPQNNSTVENGGGEVQAEANKTSDDGSKSGESFEDLINGRYKDEYTRHVSGIIGKRLQGANKQIKSQSDILTKLCVRYGVESAEELLGVIDSDEEVERAAIARGIDSGTLRELESLKSQKIAMDAQQKRAEEDAEAEKSYIEARAKADEQVERWKSEADEIRKIYPQFDLLTELKNPQFMALIQTKNPQYAIRMIDAYRMLHYDDLQKASEANAALAISKSVEQRQKRPAENGLGGGSAVNASEVSKLTKKDRAELAKRAMRGEIISF